MSKEKKALINNISSLFSVEVANYILPMVSMPVIVRIIGPDKFGIISYASAIVGYFVLIINYGFDLTATRKIAQNKGDKTYIQQLFSMVLWSKLLLFALTLLVFLTCFAVFPVFRAEWQVMVYSYVILISWIITPNWLYQGMQELHRTAIFNMVIKLMFTVAILLIIRKPSDYIYQPLALGVTQILVGYYSFHYAMRRYGISIVKIPFKQVVKVLKDERIIFFSSVVINLYTTTNTVILGSLAGTIQVGYYVAAIKFIQIAQAVITLPLSNSFFPYVGSAFGKSREDGIVAAQKVLPIVCVVSLAAFLGMITLGPWALGLFYGDKFRASIPIFVTLSIIPFLVVVSNVYGIQVMLNLNMDKLFLRITAYGAIISVFANFVLIPWYGGLGSAFSLLITELFITLACAFFLFKENINLFDWNNFHPRKLMLQFQSVLPGYRNKN